MELSAIKQTVKGLYEGPQKSMGVKLAPNLTFQDPLIIVSGRRKVMTMFRRLNRLFPNASLEHFEPLDESNRRIKMGVRYTQQMVGSNRPFWTVLELKIAAHGIVKITEHWSAPSSLTAAARSPMARIARLGLGRLVTIGSRYAD